MKRGKFVELSAQETEAVAGGVDLSNYGPSSNVEGQFWKQEGNMAILYDSNGQCIEMIFKPS